MEKFMKTCYECKVDVIPVVRIEEGIKLYGLKCPKCKEEFYTSSQLLKLERFRDKPKRKFGKLGDATIMRIPPELIKKHNISPGDYGICTSVEDGILIVPVKEK